MIGGAPLTAEAQSVMGRYGGWGAADGVFAPGASGNDLRDRERLRAVMTRLGGSAQAGEKLFNAAGLTTLNAHYTDPLLVRAMYRALGDLDLEQGNIAEAGVGAGQFAAFAPDGIRVTGIELDPATALIAQLLHPEAEILVGSVSGPRFARVRDQSASPVRVPRDTADGFAGNVPFSEVKWPDEVLNPGQKFPLHDHAILWGVTRVKPGGLCAFITSRYTADKPNPGFRRTLAGEMDLIGMVRLPSTAHKRMAGTPVVTDIIIGRRLADGERPRTDPETWEQARPLPLPGTGLTALVNAYYHANPQHVLGTITAGGMRRADDFSVEPSGDLEQQLGTALGEITGRALAAGQRHEPCPAARPVIEILSRKPDGTVSVNPDGTFTQVVHGQDVPLEIGNAREADQTRRLVALAEARAALITAEAACPEDNDETDALRARMGRLYDEYTAKYGAIGRFTVSIKNHHVKTFKGVLDRLDFSKPDVPDPEVALLEEYLGRDTLTRIVKSVVDPGHVRLGTRKDKQGNQVPTATQLIRVPSVRTALTAALAQVPQGADAERLAAAFSERMSRIETSEQRTRLMPVAFRSDPRRPAVEALENFDPVTQTAVKKPVFSRRTSVPHRLELGADTPQEALDLVLIHRRRVDLAEIARLLGTDAADARKQLGTLVFNDPAAGGALVAAGEYLSGNVHEKLAAARTAAAGDPRYAANVESLLAIQPTALGYEDIQARLGSAWLSREIVRDGLRHILDDPTLTVTHPGGAEWTVSSRKGPDAENPYGTSDWSALDMAQALLINNSIAVYRKRLDPQTGEEKSYRDDHATLYNYRRAQRLDADFVSWLWSDPDRAEQCVRLYNAAYNNQVKRKWDSSPFYIPGLGPGMRLHPFQNAMVRRLHTESGLAAWVVGAGKTELGIVAAMEGHRLGRHGLCGIVTPASLVNQWRDRIYRTYPGASVLIADDDLRARKDALEMFVERAASRDYQLAVIPYEFFGTLSLSADAARASVDEEIDKLNRYAKEAAAQGDSYTAKSLQKQIARLEAQYSAVALASGGATGFTDARITGLVIDEWHNFRRFKRDSNNREFAMDGSARGNHMLAVADHLRRHHPEGLVLGLSGTPLEQSIADAWAAMRFFTPEKLKELGLEEFDAFLTTFGRTEARREPTPTGSGLHVRERASDWFNLPEMRRTLWEPFADVIRSADLGLNVPRITGGRPQTHVLAQTPGQASVQAEIDDGYARFKAGSRDPDNHILRLMDRGAKNALHPRMLGMETDGQIKLEVWADDAAAWYHASKDTRFLDREGNPHPLPGALRMVACEIGVPDPARPNAWSVYAEMRSLLVARGVPADAVRFAQDAAGSDRKKAALWEDARTGRCNFVIGSAMTAGTGVDVPDRLQVLDFMTLGWNPTQFEQWLGRIVRQGNQNPEVAVHVWSTEGTTEVLRADKIAMKSAPFEALLDGDSGTRRVTEESFNQTSAFAADMSARMSGNPLINAQREAQLEVNTAQGMQDEWQRENGVKARRIPALNSEIQELEKQNAAIDRALGRALDTQGDKFTAQVGTARYTVRAEAGAALIATLAATAAGDVTGLAGDTPQHLGELAGFPVTARYNRFEPDPPAQREDGQDDEPDEPEPSPAERTLITLGLEGVPNGQVGRISGGDLPNRDPVALITSLEGRIRRLPGDRDKNTAAIAENRDQIAKTKAELAKPSPYLQQLADARDALDRIETQIDELIKDAAPETDAAASADAESVPASPGERAPDAGAEPADRAAAPSDSDIASLPPWTDASPYSAAIGAALQAALADSDVTQVAGSNDISRFLEWLSGAGWMNDYAAAAVGDDGEVPPFARAVLDDPVFAADLACAVGTVAHARCADQALPPGSAALRPIPPLVEMSALRHWQEHDEAIGRAADTDQWYDLVDAARIDIWLSRAGLPRAGRQVLIDSGGHAVLELAADGEQWRLTVPNPKDTRHEATARYKVTRSGRDGWAALLNGTPGSTTPEQAAALLTGTLAEEGALPPPPAAPAPGQAGITPAPPDTSARHNSPEPGTKPAAPALLATGSSDDDGDARAPQPDSGLLRNLAAAHGMHCHYDSGTTTAAVFRSESRAGQPVLRQGHPGGPLMNQAGRVIPGEHAGAYLAEAARFPDLNAGTLYQHVIPRAVAGEEASPRSTAHATFSISAIQARDTGRPQVVYADGDAVVASPEPPADGGAYYLATPHGQDVHWTRHMNGTAEPVSHHLRAGDLSVIAGETAAAGFPAPQPADGTAVREPGEGAPASPQPSAPSPSEAPAGAPGAPDAPGGPGTEQEDGGHPGSPDGVEEPGSGMTPEELDFVRQSAVNYALFGISRPSPDQEERALDYAAWYMAEFGGEDSMGDLPGHDHALRWFADRGYPAREPAGTTDGQRDQDQPGAEAAAEPAGPPGHADPEPPAGPWSAAGLRQLAEAYGLAAATDRTGGTLTVTVHDQGRTVLLHNDLNGTVAGGRRLDSAQVAAYLAAYARYPQLPPRCLLDLARPGPAEPAPLPLTAARELAGQHGLEVRVRRTGGQSYITFCEPGTVGDFAGDIETPREPVLSYPAGSDSARHGPCAVPVAAIGSYLAAYRESVPPAMFTAPEPYNWRSRLAPLTPHLIDGGGHFIPAVRDRLHAAIAAGRDGRAAEAATLLAEAEALAPVTLVPEREAELTAAVRRDAAGYPPVEDLAAASVRTLHVTARELDWVRAYIAAHPGVREHPEVEPAAPPDSDREAAASLAAQAKETFANGEYERALALIDETELLGPDIAAGYDRARDQVRTAMRRAVSASEQHADATAEQGPADEASGAAEPRPADIPRVTVLHGHTSPETAYLVGDYPYGRLRCEKRYWLDTADKGRYRGQVRLVTQTTNPKQPGRPWNKPHPEQYRAWSVMYLNQDGHIKLRSVSDWGPSGRDDAEIRLDGIYDQLDGEERAAYDKLVELGRRGRNWDSWYDALGFIRGYQAEHGALPDAGQVQATPGFYADEATSRVALAAAAAGLGGVHAGPGTSASPAAGTPAAAPPARDGEPADDTRPSSPAAQEDPGDGEPAPGQGFSWDGADFRYELAYAFAFGSNPPGSFEDERARDFAAWYMARHGGGEPGGEMPARSFEWRRFAELGYPARAPVGAEQAEVGRAAPADEPVAADAPPAGPVGSTSGEESAEAPAATPPGPGTDELDADGLGQPVGTAAPTDGALARPPEGTQPLAVHTGWGGSQWPERLLYADGTPLTVRGQGEHGAQELPATAVGAVPAPDGGGYGTGRLQVVRYDAGRYAVVHPALASPADTDPYGGLSDRDRARWQAFDYGESHAAATARLLPHLIEPGDMIYVHSGQIGPISYTMDLREVQSAGRGTGRNAGYFEFKLDSGATVPYPSDDRVLVRRPDGHPTLAAAIRAALAAEPGQPETAPPAAGQAAADTSGLAAPAPADPGEAPRMDEPAETGPYSGRVRIALESGQPVVSGTDFNDPAELRDVLRDNFTWRKKRQVWEYNRRKAGPEEAAQAVRDVLVRLDRESAPKSAVKEFPPTPQQQAILDAFLDGKGIAVQALAGTGKTTTLVLLARALLDRSPQARVVYTAFNASIVKDAKRGRFGRNVTASTMHSLARQALLQTGYAGKIEHADKGARWPEQWAEVLGIPEGTAAETRDGAAPADAAEVARLVIATVRKFRESADGEPGRQHLPYLAGPAGSPLSETVLSYARQAWADISDTGNARLLAAGRALRVEHDDYLKVWALSRPTINAEVIFFDEAQDVNDVMRRVVLDQPAQTIVVGDSHQSIYGFRGAIDALKDWPADIVLPLTQSWRFGQEAAEFGNLFLRSLGSKLLLEGNPARETRLGSAPEPDAILCRTNATAVAEVFAGLESGKRTALTGGGDAIKEIAKAARDLQAGRGTKHPDLSRFTDWDEVRQYAKNDEDGKSMQVFVRLIDQHGPNGLIDMIGRLTPEDDTRNPPQLTISTAHKAKGLEWDVVRVAGDFRGPATDPETGEVTWPIPEERRLAYVAATRARKLLEPGSLSWIYDYPLPGTRAAQGPAQGEDRQAQAAAPDAPRTDSQPEPAAHAGQEQEPAPQDSPATPGHSTADRAPGQQHAPKPATAEAPASDAAAAPPTPGTDDGARHGEQPAAAAAERNAPGTAPVTSPDAAGPPPEADDAARLRALAAQHGLTVTEERLPPTNTLTAITVTDGDRTVLRHDNISGTRSGDLRIGLDEADAYLAARRDYPGLPARALLDWVRRSPDTPAQLSLSDARAIAEKCGLTAQPVHAAGQPFIVVREPGGSATVLAYRSGDPAASTGLVTVPVPAIGAYLRDYRESISPRWPTVLGNRADWASQLSALAPYLIHGTSLHSAQARRHVTAATDAAARDDSRTVKDELRAAWKAAGPFAPSPDRQAALVRVIGDTIPRYQQITGDGARYAAEVAHASDPEWDWIYQWVRNHPDILTAATPTHEALTQRDASERAQATAEGKALVEAATAAADAGDYPAALALIDQGETADQGHPNWQRARAAILDKSAAPGDAPQPEPARQAAPAAEADEPPPQQAAAAAAAEPGAADTSASADTSPSTDDNAQPGELSPLAVPADREEGVRFLQELAARYGLQVSAVIDTLQWWTAHLSTLHVIGGELVASYNSRTGEWDGFGTGRLDSSQVTAYLAACGEGDLQDASAGATDPYTRPGQARADYHKALLAYRALRETKAGRFLVETLGAEKPRPDSNRPDAIALDAAYQAVNGEWKKAFAGDAQEAAGRFAAWAHAASAMADNLAAQRHRAGKFRAAFDVFIESAGHLASRTQATAEEPGAWARVFEGLPGSTQAAGLDPGETTAPGDAQPIAATATAPSGPIPADGTGTQPGRDEPVGDSPAGPAAAPPARKAAEPRSYRLTRQLPDGTIKEHSTAFTSLRAAAQAVAYTLADNGAADRKDAAAFASRLQDAAPGTTMTHPSGYSFTIRLVAAVAPLANMDLAAELDRMPGAVFARWLSVGATPPAAGDLDYQRPGAGSWAVVGEDGIEITVGGPDVTRHGLLSWPEIASWIDKGVTPARLGIVGAASRLGAFVEQHRDQLTAAGTCDPGAVAAELAQIRATTIAAIVEAARRSRGTAVPVPPALPGDPAWHTAVAVTRPGHGPGRAENKALERLLALRSLVREPQPLTPHEVRDAIRRKVDLAEVARAMRDPAAMRAWINRQASALPSGRYDDSGQTWRGTGPDGLTVDRHGDDRAPHVIPWDHVLAWVAPGLTDGLREELLAADDASRTLMHRKIGAVINPGTQPEPPGAEQNQTGRRLREADNAAWAAIQAAPPPSPADFDRARYATRDTSPVQETLFGDPPPDGTNTRRPAKASQPRQDETPGTPAASKQTQPEAPAQAASSQQTRTDPAGQASQGANAKDTQAPPAAASQEPPPVGHGDSPADGGGTTTPPQEFPAREPEEAPDLPPSAGSPAPGREADPNPAAAQDAAAPEETATAGTAGAEQEHDTRADPAVADDAPPDQIEHEAAATARREAARERSRVLRDEAAAAYRAGRYTEALALADSAQFLDPAGAQYDRFRHLVTAAAADAAHAAPSPGGTDRQSDGEPAVPLAPHPQPELRQDKPPTTAADSAPRRHVAPAQVNDLGTRPARASEPAAAPQPASGPEPLNADDVFLGVSRLPSFVIGDLFHAVDNGQPLESVSRQLPSHSGERAAGEPDAGARETVAAVPAGLRIEVAGPNGRRAGLVTWPQVDNLLRPGATPTRRQIVTRAWQVHVSFMGANDSFRAVGEGSLAAAAEDELRALAATAVGAILDAVRPAGRTRPPQPVDEAAMTGRIAALAAALPAQPRRPRTPAAEVTAGDIIGHHSYRFHPFLVTEPPRQADAAVEITGRLTEPAPGEPAGPFTLTVPLGGRQGAVVTVIPVPARSLRPLFPGHGSTARASQPAVTLPGPAESTGAPSAPVTAPADEPHATQPRSQEETMPPATRSTALPVPPAPVEPGAATEAPPAAPSPAPPGTGRIRYAGRGEPSGAPAPGNGTDGASMADELERLLGALRECRGAADGGPGDADFSDIRAAFAAMRDALSLPAVGQETGPRQPIPVLPAAPPAAGRAPRGEPGPAAGGFTDIREAFADLRDILGLPAQGRHARGDGPPDETDGAAVASALDQAAAEAQACARWYRDAPEWQRTITVSRAARDLVTAIRDAAGDYWAEIRQDIRVRGFARTLAARTALAVSGAAHVLAGRLERAGHRDTRIWRAAWRLHQATTTFANRVIRYAPPGSPDRMREARRIIEDLGQRQNRPRQPEPGRHAAPHSVGGARTPNAAALASASFPVMVTRANAGQATAAPTARAAAPAPRTHAARRQ